MIVPMVYILPGGPNVPLKCPNRRNYIRITPDGNCLFRAMSHIITGSQMQHMEVRMAILAHLTTFSDLFVRFLDSTKYKLSDPNTAQTIQTYIATERMDKEGTWGTHIEIYGLVHLLNTAIFVYTDHCRCRNLRACTCPPTDWLKYSTSSILGQMGIDSEENGTAPAMYIYHPQRHFDVVRTIVK